MQRRCRFDRFIVAHCCDVREAFSRFPNFSQGKICVRANEIRRDAQSGIGVVQEWRRVGVRFFGLSAEIMRFRSGDAAQFGIVRGDMRYGFIELAWFGGSGMSGMGSRISIKLYVRSGIAPPLAECGKEGI